MQNNRLLIIALVLVAFGVIGIFTTPWLHSLPDPKVHTGAEWPETIEKMRAYMRSMDKKVITTDEEREVIGYLQIHARK